MDNKELLSTNDFSGFINYFEYCRPDVDFVFITSEELSPLGAYNNFVKEQELTHTYRINADQYRYLRQLFRFNGIPRYVLVDKEGNMLDDNAIISNLERRLVEAYMKLSPTAQKFLIEYAEKLISDEKALRGEVDAAERGKYE